MKLKEIASYKGLIMITIYANFDKEPPQYFWCNDGGTNSFQTSVSLSLEEALAEAEDGLGVCFERIQDAS
jgi:hypothetical protein